jgi:hypothetical protein
VSVLIAAPILLSLALQPKPVDAGGVRLSPDWCALGRSRHWSTLTSSEKAARRVAPLLDRRRINFAPTLPPFPPVI